ncbi:LacI family transcriptional regulator [Microlunatus phosphovorus NM-1]|uniref:LacI family transcriptional regulator n=1 Tax=Microlunatus phosphovorus (strain ATCC 700054 / DSM 10555 / JCM 9379 / NBRC 101784 / NCIMB 13414 / VKM Ac-1990 / NM-1) TaxID=1032480 RepID=F5XPQ0_MICPN|nr:LacI family DNA-binding transcriptional regulator [Microlunatus phosphovorus]BAK34358.1 LacI family transcriptional regulator [Microlunatus phosphovorus NM-1]
MSNGPMRLADVADAAGVSLATASRSLRGLTGVSDEVAARVRKTAEDLGYVVNTHAQTLAGGTTSIAGLIVHQIDDPYFTEIAAGVVHAAEERGLIVQVAHSGRDPQREVKQLHSLVAQRARVIVIAGSGYVDGEQEAEARRLLSTYQRNGGRVAVVGRHQLGVDALLPDNRGAARAVAEHLVELGHQEIAIVSGPAALTTVQDRLAGAQEVLSRAGARWHVVPTDFTAEGAGPAAIQALRDWPDVTAILALNDSMAIAILVALRRLGVSVPGEISVAGIDDVSVAELLYPSLTTARFPLERMGRDALELATRPAAARPRRKAVSAELVVRESTATPRVLPIRSLGLS